jgi:hypothetical protein
VAQKIQGVHPSLVKEDPEDGWLKVNYGIVTALLAPAVSELHKQIMELKNEVATLKAAAVSSEGPSEPASEPASEPEP